jgi:23S rRNA pseudouridine2605 synthase
MAPLVRLQKHLARAGVASRRAAEVAILAGRVKVNGRIVRELGSKIEPERDSVEFDGRPVHIDAPVWIALHKPRGFVCTRDDPRGRPTIYDLLPPECRTLFNVGRLDADSEGLVLLTNDGDAAQLLLHPRYGAERVYVAEVQGRMLPDDILTIRSGVELVDGPARVKRARILHADDDRTRVQLVLAEGRKREVRRIFGAVGHPVRRLRRIRHGGIRLGRLGQAEWRWIGPDELRASTPHSVTRSAANHERPAADGAGTEP